MPVIKGLLLVVFFMKTDCRKSDYKRVIFSEYVKNEMENNFKVQLDVFNHTDRNVFELYEKLWKEQRDAKLVRDSTRKGMHGLLFSPACNL